MKTLEESSVDGVFSDPPYKTTDLDFDKLDMDWQAWWKEINRVCRPHANIVIFAAQPFATALINSNPKGFRYDMIWAKTQSVGFLSANKRPLRAHELILLFSRRSQAKAAWGKVPIYNPQLTEGKPYRHRARQKQPLHYRGVRGDSDYQNAGTRHPTSVLTYARDVPSFHPTAKPVELCRWLLRSFTHQGDLVLDTFCGGGSFGVAARLEERRFIGMEIDERFADIAEQRLQGRC